MEAAKGRLGTRRKNERAFRDAVHVGYTGIFSLLKFTKLNTYDIFQLKAKIEFFKISIFATESSISNEVQIHIEKKTERK